ncbi:MAG: alpha/beta hydrolase [Rhodanobacteraceae bacterium]|nr:alpha/beta hydrolase [Rhodanobacteraceae bacterium]
MKEEAVILVHGVWMRAFSLLLLRQRLRDAGFHAELFSYASVLGNDARSLERLCRHAEGLEASKVHFVGHSLGGLLAIRAANQFSHDRVGRVVCLGSPLNGSAVARRLPKLLGAGADMLCRGLMPTAVPAEVGVIAGTQPIGLGRLMGAFSGPNDGTVSVAETRWSGVTAHCEVNTSHSGLTLSREVADLTAYFLRSGCFETRRRT